jgi:hypothetical protein
MPDCVDGRLTKGLPEPGVEKMRGVAETGNHGFGERIAQLTRAETPWEATLIRENSDGTRAIFQKIWLEVMRQRIASGCEGRRPAAIPAQGGALG